VAARRWALEQQICARARLGKRDHIANGLGLAENGHEPVKACQAYVNQLR
jgi:hypothetical protein